MLIKIDKDRYINSEHISMIAPSTNGDPNVYFIALLGRNLDSEGIETTAAVVEYIKTILDADDHYSEDTITLSLSSRLAIDLSNRAAPASLNDLVYNFDFLDAGPEAVEVSLNELLANNVIRSELRNGVPYYSHAANASHYAISEGEDLPTW